MPPAAALEREMVELGVSPKQKDKARQVFERSAEQAGFFATGGTGWCNRASWSKPLSTNAHRTRTHIAEAVVMVVTAAILTR